MGSHRLLDDPFFPFPPPPSSSSTDSSCPLFGVAGFLHHSAFSLDLDPFHAPTPLSLLQPFPFPALYPFLLPDRVAALELAVAARPQPSRRKYTYVTEAAGRKVKWTTEDKPRGERAFKWEAELKFPHDAGIDRKWKWESNSNSAPNIKWGAELKGKGCLEQWSHAYTWEKDFSASDDDDKADKEEAEKKKTNRAKEDKVVKGRRNAPSPSRSRRSPRTTLPDVSPSERLLLWAMARERGRNCPHRMLHC